MPPAEHHDLTDDERAMYTAPAVSDRTARILTWALGVVFGATILFMVFAATVLKKDEAPGVSYAQIEAHPIYVHQPPQSTDIRVERGSSAVNDKDSAHRYVVRTYITKVTPEQVREFYLRRFGVSYSIADTSRYNTRSDLVLRGNVVESERTTADPPVLSVRIAIAKQMTEERTRVLLTIESDY